MQNYEMMVVDLDGTLLNSKSQLEAATKSILRRCMEQGKKIVLCSSRSYEEMRIIAEELYEGCRSQYCIGFGGAASYTQDGICIVRAASIEDMTARRMITLAENSHIHIHGYDENVLYYYRRTNEFDTFVNFADVADIPMRQIPYEDFLEKDYLKLMCLGDMVKLAEYNRVVSSLASTAFSNPAGQQGYLDMIHSKASKGTGVEQLCRYLKIPMEQCICVGDGENDISMLQKAGIGVAMKNGTDSAKVAADYVVPYSNDENAIGYLAEKFL